MALLALQDANGFAEQAAAGGGDQIPQGTRAGGWDLPVVLYVRNGDVADKTVTINGVDTVVVAGSNALIPVGGIYRGQARPVVYSAVTSLFVAAVDLTLPLT